ncbi:UNKNOWN [Stylonychia lemnae]|uniref:Uncharacterized protein n=1 Tax=Stylonychia lemnae TaxID=5949 RepID=A0A078AZ73_STYLE|nr:UNKNOWN [Stylonychia lemnae]|eukprot:CDW87750.1 UNKNOWN [Stylonychia lemnae]
MEITKWSITELLNLYVKYLTKPLQLGNSGRQPLLPPQIRPFESKIYENYEFSKFQKKILNDALYKYKEFWDKQLFHPVRELNDSIIYDGEHDRDLLKRIDESRHQIALQLVAMGMYQDIFEAKEGQRERMIKDSNYRYKHLLYRQ